MMPDELELQRREIAILKLCQHPNVIRLVDSFETLDNLFIVTEFMKCDLFEYLNNKQFKITESKVSAIALQLASGLHYLHSMNIIHRDVKLENIMLKAEPSRKDGKFTVMTLKLVDFGLSKVMLPRQSTRDPFGTMGYVSPEVLSQTPYREKVDCYSVGVIIYVMLSGMLPFDSEHNRDIARMTLNNPVSFQHKLWDFVTPTAKQLILSLMRKQGYERLSIEELLKDTWLTRNTSPLIMNMRRCLLKEPSSAWSQLEKFTAFSYQS